jgi:hypothetical protein
MEGGAMKIRTLVCSTFICMLMLGCVPAAPASESTTVPTNTALSAPTFTLTPTTAGALAPDQPTATLIVAPQPALVNTATAFSLPAPGTGNTGGPQASPKSAAVNCRGGPDIIWPVGAHLEPGQSTEVVGKNGDASWWYVRNPTSPENFCWVSGLWVNVVGNTANLPFVAAIGTPNINGTPYGTITDVAITLDPQVISAPGCVGPIPQIKVSIKIATSGPIQIKWHFEGDEIPNLPEHKLTFDRADIQDVTEKFTPPVNDGTHGIYFIVEDMNLSVNNAAHYTINC